MDKVELIPEEKLKLIDEVLTRSVGEFVDPDGTFRKKLEAKARGENIQINIKFGIDPTRPDIHLGHAAIFRTLKSFQLIGCRVIFLIGDFTALIGDPTGKSKVRPKIHVEEVKRNKDTYLEQIGKLLLLEDSKFSWMVNSDWYTDISDIFSQKGFYDENALVKSIENIKGISDKKAFLETLSKENTAFGRSVVWEKTRRQLEVRADNSVDTVSLRTFLAVLSKITFARLIERDMFQKRVHDNEPLFMHEMMYPVLQGLDSNVLAKIYGTCDLEIGGTDQTFNMLMARDTMSVEFPPEKVQSVLSLKILEGIDGKEKMSKSLDNYIAITDEPNEMFGKTMSIPDTSIANYFELSTDVPMDEVEKIKEQLEDKSVNPRDLKVRLAREIVTLYHGAEAGAAAEQYFIDTFSKGQVPTEMPSITATEGMALTELLVAAGVATSKGEARRKIEQGGVSINDTRIEDFSAIVSTDHKDAVVKVGKKDFFRIVF